MNIEPWQIYHQSQQAALEVCVKVIPHLPKADEELIGSLLASAQAIPRLIIEGYAHRDNGFAFWMDQALDYVNEMVVCLDLVRHRYSQCVDVRIPRKLIRIYGKASGKIHRLARAWSRFA